MAQPPTRPPQWSPDGRWWWDGENWLAAGQTPAIPPAAAPEAVPGPLSPPRTATRLQKWLVALGCGGVVVLPIFVVVWLLSGDLLSALIILGTLAVVVGVSIIGGKGEASRRAIPATFRVPIWALSIFWVLGPGVALFFWREWARGRTVGSFSDFVNGEVEVLLTCSALALVGSLFTLSFSFSVLSDRIRHRSFLRVREIRYSDLTSVELTRRKDRTGDGAYVLIFRGGPHTKPVRIWATEGVYRDADIQWALSRIAEGSPQAASQLESVRAALAN